ncbi:MAG: hypothetical protein HKN27_02285, partial [Silicimonas sp.]|nr:hypothetical protein [Silicimonas sp.]
MFVGDLEIFENAARMVHVLMLTLCFWLVIAADLTAAKTSIRPLNDLELSRLHRFHSALATGLVLLWISGTVLIGIKTGFDLSQFSPKLFAKVIVVTVLTANAFVIGHIALPFYEKNRGMCLGDFNAALRMPLAICGAVSTSSWISALALGAIPALKTASAVTLINLLGLFYVGNIVVSVVLVLLIQRRSLPASSRPRRGYR